MLTKSLNEVLKGFFWGLGFAIAVIGLASVYSLTIAASVDLGFKKNVRLHAMSSFEDFASDYELSLSEIFKENGRVKITAELKNISNDELYAMGVVASTFDSNGRFIGNCAGKGPEISLSPAEVSYVEIDCNLFKTQSERVHSAKLTLKWI